MPISGLHHIAVICSNYPISRRFYVEILRLRVVRETFRAERDSHKCDIALPDGSQIELFSFPSPPPRPSYPEACGLRHPAFAVHGLDAEVARLSALGIAVEPIRLDEATGCRYTFFADPDGLPLEMYEVASV